MNENQLDNTNRVEELLGECEIANFDDDYERIIELTGELLETEPDNQIAIGYRSFAYIRLHQYEKASKLLERGCRLYPKNHYLKENRAMLYYDLGEYEKAIECCQAALKIKNSTFIWEMKIRALIRLNRTTEAIELSDHLTYDSMEEILLEERKFDEALECAMNEDIYDFYEFIDRVKDAAKAENLDMPYKLEHYHIAWIYKIRAMNDTARCPDCAGRLVPIIWGMPSEKMLEMDDMGKIHLGGCVVLPNPANYHCRDCGHEFHLGHRGLDIEPSNESGYIEHKIDEMVELLMVGPLMVVKSIENLKRQLEGYDEREFNAFIDHMMDIGFIYEPKRGYVRLSGFDDWDCMNEYLDKDKFAAPPWLAYPQFSAGSMFWTEGGGRHYVESMPKPAEVFEELFLKPRNWTAEGEDDVPLLGNFWRKGGRPKYSNTGGEIEVNGFITMNLQSVFSFDTFRFNSIEHAMQVSQKRLIDKCSDGERLWEIYKYSVCLNAAYYKVMNDDALKSRLLETGNQTLVYISDDEWGSGENLFGRALMELRDEIRRLYKNADRIDWAFTKSLKYSRWW